MIKANYKWMSDEDTVIQLVITDSLSELSMHWQEDMEIMYFYRTSGCNYIINGNTIHLSEKNLVVVNPGEIHGCSDWGENCVAMCLMIDTKKLHTPSFINLFLQNKYEANSEITKIFESLKAVFEKHTAISVSAECEIMSVIYRLLSVLAEISGTNHNKSDTARKIEIKKIVRFISDNLEDKLTLSTLASKMNLSCDRFYHVFKEYVGVSPSQYILLERISKASRLLSDTNLSITQIAQMCGFCTSSYFSDKFKEYIKMSPTKYRKKQKQQKLGML